jgi:Uma2 family endonuclease
MPATITTRKFTVEEFIRLDQMRFFQPDEKLELLDGEIHPMSPSGNRHVLVLALLDRWLQRNLGDSWLVLCQSNIRLGKSSLPQPDIAVVRFLRESFQTRLPSHADAHLVVEVADTSTDIDLGRKLELYAQAGIPEYWVFNLTAEVLEVFTLPGSASYQSHQRLTATDTARSESLGISLPLADFLKQG